MYENGRVASHLVMFFIFWWVHFWQLRDKTIFYESAVACGVILTVVYFCIRAGTSGTVFVNGLCIYLIIHSISSYLLIAAVEPSCNFFSEPRAVLNIRINIGFILITIKSLFAVPLISVRSLDEPQSKGYGVLLIQVYLKLETGTIMAPYREKFCNS